MAAATRILLMAALLSLPGFSRILLQEDPTGRDGAGKPKIDTIPSIRGAPLPTIEHASREVA
jgi:hypothetical protein